MGVVKFLDRLEEYLCSASLAVMVLINFANVLSRYIFKASWSFSEELLIILFVWCMMLASATAFKRSEHLGLTLFSDIMPNLGKRFCVVLAFAATVTLSLTLVIMGWRMVDNQILSNQLTPVLMLPEAVAGLAIPFGSLVILVRATQSYIREFIAIGAKKGEEA